MTTQGQLQKHAGQLLLSLNSGGCTVLSIDREMPLGAVMERLQDQHYVLATDSDGHITGIVSTERICDRLEAANQFERRRWQQMPLSSLLNVTFSSQDTRSGVMVNESVDCVAIAEGNRLFGMAIEDDIFLSWRQLESLLSEALSDPLTGLLNRLAYERRLQEEWGRATRTGMSVGVVVVDLDSFKRINDTLGHPAGDAVLQAIGHQLEASMRSYDVVARFGGDEFVALCLGCSAGDIAIPVERIQRGISELEICFEGQPIHVTASIGAAVRHDGFDMSDPRELFSAADECLYHAKASPESAWRVELGGGCSGIPEPLRFTPCGGGIRRPVDSKSAVLSSVSAVAASGEEQ